MCSYTIHCPVHFQAAVVVTRWFFGACIGQIESAPRQPPNVDHEKKLMERWLLLSHLETRLHVYSFLSPAKFISSAKINRGVITTGTEVQKKQNSMKERLMDPARQPLLCGVLTTCPKLKVPSSKTLGRRSSPSDMPKLKVFKIFSRQLNELTN